ncbi:TniB family NTP-binding protein [Pseudomonas sp. D(2018)]|uniref:TniB family NTP-binding protein n=1 Tax=Pseudomonas sp. D(2018) TaxID=2502238 RepID=UPI0010F6ABE1|nr:TniB family NTP-binding protein [Pseudomonas sp. D(2018)]
MSEGNHLSPQTEELLRLPAAQRIAAIQSDRFYIDNPQSLDVLNIIENIIKVPQRTQAPCLIVTGAGGSGKTSIVQQVRLNRALAEQIVYIDMAANPFNLKFGELLVSALGLPVELMPKFPAKRVQMPKELIEVIRLRRIRGIIIDELQDAMLVARLEQQKNLSILKWFTNPDVAIPILGFGVSEAKNALKLDPQLERRFFSFEMSDWKEDESFRSFLAGVEQNIPLKHASQLDGAELVGCLLQYTSGRMGGVMQALKSAACYAVSSGEERITPRNIHKAILSPWGY